MMNHSLDKRAESPIINSVGQRPTKKSTHTTQAQTGRNQLLLIGINRLRPFRACEEEGVIPFTGRCHCANDLWLSAIGKSVENGKTRFLNCQINQNNQTNQSSDKRERNNRYSPLMSTKHIK
jgi:hypothetical protein